MNTLMLARVQFAVTTAYHFLFVPLTIGLALLLALMETAYVRTGDETYKRMTKFWGKLFLINFALGVATGIVQEFQFGMNWSEYARFVGDIFGAPLAVEALLAFFLESTFLGIWIFGWDKLSKRAHATAIWIVAIGTQLSAVWILAANAWMQHPVGYVLRHGRAELDDFFALLLNPHFPREFGHVIFGCVATAGFFMLGITSWHLWRRRGSDVEFFRRSFHWAAIYAVIGSVGVALVGHMQGQWIVQSQPMKLAAAEAHWKTEDYAGFIVAANIDEVNQRNTWALKLPSMLSILAYNDASGIVKGIKNLQEEYSAKYGPGDYAPSIPVTFWSFRVMVGAGLLMLLIALIGLWLSRGRRVPELAPWFARGMIAALFLPYIANTAGWMVAEVGRQPWVVFGLMKTATAVSLSTPAAVVLTSLIVFTVVYSALMAVDIWLLRKFALRGPVDSESQP
ncbi:MAG: cytochrome ubiquinol oxidase subunit I [Kiritimatiellaeota bacterium]|nr:cytochrome ubiquinol oxidase subunit I [Kiritimatiellota bacterium]